MTVPRPAALLAALLLGLVVPVVAACGQDDSALLSSSRADTLRSDLEAVETAIAEGRCQQAREALDELDRDVDGIPGEVDRALRQRLRDGVERLAQQVPEACERNRPEPEPETVPEETIPEEPVPEETLPEETVPEETVPEETVPEETVPEEPVPEPEVPQDPGGTEAPEGGFVPPGQAKKDDGR